MKKPFPKMTPQQRVAHYETELHYWRALVVTARADLQSKQRSLRRAQENLKRAQEALEKLH